MTIKLGYPLPTNDQYNLFPTDRDNKIPWQLAFEVRDRLRLVPTTTREQRDFISWLMIELTYARCECRDLELSEDQIDWAQLLLDRT